MKRLLFVLILLLSQPLSGYTKDFSTRIGVTIGSGGLLSFNVERHFGDNSVRLNLGVYGLNELMISATFNHYFTQKELRPFVGIGLWNVFIFPEQGTGRIDIITIPVGLDWNVGKEHYAGAQADLNIFIRGRSPFGGKVKFNKRFMALPGVYYKYRL